MTQLSILMTSDTHAHWLNYPEEPDHSLLKTASCIQDLKDQMDHSTLTIDLGDFIQGSSFATYLFQEKGSGRALARAMNAIGYDYQVLGNHEFNFGPDYRQEILEDLEAPILNANLLDAKTQKPIVGQPYAIRDFDGVKVGIIGVTTHYIPFWEAPDQIQGIDFKDAFETTKHYVKFLRPQVDVLVVAYHGGFERDLQTREALVELTGENQGSLILDQLPEIDVLLSGHQHRVLNQKVGDTWVIQTGDGGHLVGEVTLNLEGGKIQDIQGKLHEVDAYPSSVKVRQALEPDYQEGDDWLNQVVGQAPLAQTTADALTARIQGHPFVELLNQIQMDYFQTTISSVALVNDYFSQFTGPISQELLLKTYPYYNRLALVQVRGSDLYQAMEHNLDYFQVGDAGQIEVNPAYLSPKPQHYHYDLYSGLRTEVDLTQPVGQRVVSLIEEASQQPIDPDQTYQVAMTQYRASGGGDFSMFDPSMILELSEVDLATLLRQAIQPGAQTPWDQINQNYKHITWLPTIDKDH